jgi:hypothetical protein
MIIIDPQRGGGMIQEVEPDWPPGCGGRLGAWAPARLPSRFRLLFGPELSRTL